MSGIQDKVFHQSIKDEFHECRKIGFLCVLNIVTSETVTENYDLARCACEYKFNVFKSY